MVELIQGQLDVNDTAVSVISTQGCFRFNIVLYFLRLLFQNLWGNSRSFLSGSLEINLLKFFKPLKHLYSIFSTRVVSGVLGNVFFFYRNQ